MQLGDQNTRAHEAGQNDMFGLAADDASRTCRRRAPRRCRSGARRCALPGERETLGLYLTGHPLARFEASLKRFVSHRIGDLVSDRPTAGFEAPRFGGGKPVTVAGLIDEVKKRGPRVILTLDDRTGRIEVMLFEDIFQKYRDLIAKDALVLVDGSLRFDEFSRRLAAVGEEAHRAGQGARAGGAPAGASAARTPRCRCCSERLAEILTPWRPGPCPITIEYTGREACGALTLDGQWSVRASRELLEQIEALVGRGSVQVRLRGPAGRCRAAGGTCIRRRRRSRTPYRRTALRTRYRTWPLHSSISSSPSPSSKRRSRSSSTSPRNAEVNIQDEINRLQAKSRQLTTSIFASLTPWQITQLARHPHRPYTLDYVTVDLQ